MTPGTDVRTRAAIRALLDEIPKDFGGGCSVEKAHVLAWLIQIGRVRSSLDIGVYRGRSFFPQALAHQRFTGGVVYGVDPYSKAEAQENDNFELRDQIAQFIEATDFDALFRDVQDLRKRCGLERHAKLVRRTSAAAARQFRQQQIAFGLIHIDGNHDQQAVLDDVRAYLPLLGAGGFLVMDDISWSSVKQAVDEVQAALPLLYARVDSRNDYAVFWRPAVARGNGIRLARLRSQVGRIGSDRL